MSNNFVFSLRLNGQNWCNLHLIAFHSRIALKDQFEYEGHMQNAKKVYLKITFSPLEGIKLKNLVN